MSNYLYSEIKSMARDFKSFHTCRRRLKVNEVVLIKNLAQDPSKPLCQHSTEKFTQMKQMNAE